MLRVVRLAPDLAWQAFDGGELRGTVQALARPDKRCSIFFASCQADAYGPLVEHVARDVDHELHVSVDEDDGDLRARLEGLGFEVDRHEGHYSVPTSPDLTGLGSTEVPQGAVLISAGAADEDRLRLLDDELRQDVPGADGWQWDEAGFRAETFGSSEFDPATYAVAVEQETGSYVGLARVWNRPEGPRLGLIAVLAPYRRQGLAKSLLAATFKVLHDRGQADVMAEIDSTNVASLSLLGGMGARRTGGTVELVKRR